MRFLNWLKKATVREAPVAPVPPAPALPRTSELPPLVAAMAKTPDANGAVQVLPPGQREHATGFTVKVSKLVESEVADFCRENPLFETMLDPPAEMSLADRSLYLMVLKGIKDWDRAMLYKKGGIPLIREAVLAAMAKLKAKQG